MSLSCSALTRVDAPRDELGLTPIGGSRSSGGDGCGTATPFGTLGQARAVVADWKQNHNRPQRHSSLDTATCRLLCGAHPPMTDSHSTGTSSRGQATPRRDRRLDGWAHLAAAGIDASVGAVGDALDNALAEPVIGLFKTELIRRGGPWRTVEHVEAATLGWVDWCNRHRLLEINGDLPPIELEHAHYRHTNQVTQAG